MRRIVSNGSILIMAFVVASSGAVARAQDSPPVCPEAATPRDASAPTPLEAAEQALCWYEQQRASAPSCVTDGDAALSTCMRIVGEWCERAALDADPQVPNACFLARVRAGRHDEAARTLALVDRAWPEVETCRRAYSEGIELRVEAREPVEVLVASASIGTSATATRIPHPWWRQHVEVATTATDAPRRTRQPVDLVALFDPTRCTLRPLVMELSGGGSIRHPARRRMPGATAPARLRSSSTGWLVLGAAGIALGLGGGTLLVVSEVEAADLRNPSAGTRWTADDNTQLGRIDALRLVGGLLLGVAVAAIGGATIGWLSDLEGSAERP